MDQVAHGEHGDHGHDGHHDMNHGEHANVASAAMAAVTSTVASVLNGMQADHIHSQHSPQVDHGSMNHANMGHGNMGNNSMDHGSMNYASMDHGSMDHGSMDHGSMDHGSMDHSGMDNTGMDHGGMDDGGMDHGSMGQMKMWFHTGYTEIVLFESWKISTVGGLIGSMVGIFFMAALYEGLKYYREYLFWRTYNALQYRSVTIPAEKGVASEDNQIVQPTMFSWMHGFQTLLHIIQMVLSYFLMLIFMTYNVWLCMAVVLGAAVGYFLFGWKKPVVVDVTEHCH